MRAEPLLQQTKPLAAATRESLNMGSVVGPFVAVLLFLVGGIGGLKPSSGYCIENQCFTLFRDPVDFSSARGLCRVQGGHLMSLRSSVSDDILVILMGNTTGRLWVGLHLPSGCPDAAAELKGFQWVTEDSNSDFYNWAPGFDSSCSSHRCVSVSKVSDFKWTQTPCGEQAAGFLCESVIDDPCKALPFEQDESVAYMSPMGFGGEDGLSWPPGSTAVRSSNGVKYVCNSGQWLQGPWSCEIDRGGCEYKCSVNSRKAPSCSCPPGHTVHPVNRVSCVDATDGPCDGLMCEYACLSDGETYACACDRGFQIADDGRTCVDLDECTDPRQCPGHNFKCVNAVGSFQCVCRDGFVMASSRCVDEDECVSAPCEHVCVNTPGSYKCSCYPGYKVDPESPNTCQLHCGAEECPAECDPNDDSQCFCPRGYISEERDDGTFCLDIDECSFDYCDQKCQNTFGSYACTCDQGYILVDQYKCVKTEDHVDGTTTPKASRPPSVPTTPRAPYPGPTREPVVSVGGLVGIIVCAVSFVMLLVFLVHHIFNREKGEVKDEAEAHSLERVASDS